MEEQNLAMINDINSCLEEGEGNKMCSVKPGHDCLKLSLEPRSICEYF